MSPLLIERRLFHQSTAAITTWSCGRAAHGCIFIYCPSLVAFSICCTTMAVVFEGYLQKKSVMVSWKEKTTSPSSSPTHEDVPKVCISVVNFVLVAKRVFQGVEVHHEVLLHFPWFFVLQQDKEGPGGQEEVQSCCGPQVCKGNRLCWAENRNPLCRGQENNIEGQRRRHWKVFDVNTHFYFTNEPFSCQTNIYACYSDGTLHYLNTNPKQWK